MSGANQFGSIVTPAAVRRAMIATLDEWMDTYLGELERLEGYHPGQIQRPLGIISMRDFEKWPEDQLPVIVVMCDRLANRPARRADGKHEAAWAVGVGALCSDTNLDDTRQLAESYGAAIRAAILQHKSLGGFADFTSWDDEAYDDVASQDGRTLASARVVFTVGVENAVSDMTGPRIPLSTPAVDPGAWPTVTSATANLIPVGIEEPVA